MKEKLFGDLTIESAPPDYQREIIMPLLKWGVSVREMIRKNIENGISINPNALKDKEEDNNNDDGKLEQNHNNQIYRILQIHKIYQLSLIHNQLLIMNRILMKKIPIVL